MKPIHDNRILAYLKIILLLLILIVPCMASASEQPESLTADHMYYDPKSGVLTAKDNVRYHTDNYQLTCDHLQYKEVK